MPLALTADGIFISEHAQVAPKGKQEEPVDFGRYWDQHQSWH